MIVIDASVLAAYILKEPGWENLEDYLLLPHSVPLVIKEVANAIWKAKYRGVISSSSANKKFSALLSLAKINIVLHDQSELIEEAYKISLRNNITIYDSIYIALAKKLKAERITMDQNQYNIALKEGVKALIPI